MFCPSLRWCCVQGACSRPCFCSQHPVFALGSSKVAVGFFGLFVSFGSRICPTGACTQLFLVPYSFFVFCCSRRGVSRCKHCSTSAKGPRSQPVSFPRKNSTPLFLRGKGPKVSSSETSSCWTGAIDPSLPQRCRSPLLTVLRTCRDLGHSPLEWAEFLEPS